MLIFFVIALRNFSATNGYSIVLPTEIKFKFCKKIETLGAGEILLTSMDRDGTKKGYDLDLTKKVSNLVNIPVIASGGVGSLEHARRI